MILESKIKQAAVLAAVDIRLKRMKKSPERCARNLLELGFTSYPCRISKQERDLFYNQILELCKLGELSDAKNLFIDTFIIERV